MAMMSGTPALTPMPLRIAASTAGAPATVSGMECEPRGRGPDGQMLEHGALDLLLRLCGTWSAVRSGDRLALHYCRSADRRRPPPVGRKFRGGDGDNLRMESTRKP